MNRFNFVVVAAVGAGLSAGCASASSDAAASSQSADLSHASSALYKELTPQVAVPTDNPIGKPITSFFRPAANEKTQKTVLADGTTYEWAENAAGVEVLARQTRGDQVVVWDTHDNVRRAYIAYANGRVTYYTEGVDGAQADITLDDSNDDGRVDWMSQPVRTIPGFKLEGYDPSWTAPEKIYNRVLEDTNFDGKFDREGVTGDSWTRDEP